MSKKNNTSQDTETTNKKSSVADAAFKKKVTIIMGCILLVFIIGVVAVILSAWVDNKKKNEDFAKESNAFVTERDSVRDVMETFEKSSETTQPDLSKILIEVKDSNFYYWISELDSTYQCDRDDVRYGRYAGAPIHIQGMIVAKDYSAGTQYWLYRLHTHDENEVGTEDEFDTGHQIPIEVIFEDSNTEIPGDGTWIDVVGVVGIDSTKNLSAVRHAELTVMETPGTEYVN